MVLYLNQRTSSSGITLVSLHYALSLAAQCIVIGHVSVWVCLCVCGFVCGSVTTITRNCMHRSSPNWSLGEGGDHLQLIKFWPSCAPGKGSAAGRKFLAPPYYSQRAVFASLRALFPFPFVSSDVLFVLVCIDFCRSDLSSNVYSVGRQSAEMNRFIEKKTTTVNTEC